MEDNFDFGWDAGYGPGAPGRFEGPGMAVLTRVCFRGGSVGEWRVLRMQTLAGPALEPVASLNRQDRPGPAADGAVWSLHGVTSHQRYVYGREKLQLEAVQAGLGRPERFEVAARSAWRLALHMGRFLY